MTHTLEELETALRKYRCKAKAAKSLGLASTTYRRYLIKARQSAGLSVFGTAVPKSNGRSLEEFSKTFNRTDAASFRVAEALRALRADGWLYDRELAKLASVSCQELARVRAEFEDRIVVVNQAGRRVWAGSAEMAAKMRAALHE